MKILAIETSCDETSIALIKIENIKKIEKLKFKIIKNYIASQINIFKNLGGVIPYLAKREHLKNLPILFKKIIKPKLKIDFLAITTGPGLEPCLWTGINFIQTIQKKYFPKTKIIGTNHLNGHLYSFFLTKKYTNFIKNHNLNELFPATALIISGGHTILLNLENLKKIKKLGETRDDAIGEAFDKVARLLNLPYPGGPEIEKIAKKGKNSNITFPKPMYYQKNFDFSFSGLKTAILYFLKNNPQAKKEEIAFSFQKSAFDIILHKTLTACKQYQTKSIFISGGVAANKTLRKLFLKETKKMNINFFAPNYLYNTDNAAIIGVAAFIQNFILKKNYPLKANGTLNY